MRSDPKQIEADRGTHNIGNRIDRADFVKVHLFDRRAVHLGFGFGELGEDPSLAKVLLPVGKSAGVDHVRDVVQVAVGMLRLVLDTSICVARNPCFLTSVAVKPATRQTERVDAGLNRSPGRRRRRPAHRASCRR